MNKIILLVFALYLAPSLVSSWGVPYGRYSTDYSMFRKVNSSSREFIKHKVKLAASPNCVTRDGDTVHCFYRTKKHTVGHTSFEDGAVSGTWDYGTQVLDQPQVVEYGTNGFFVFFITKDSHIVCVGFNTDTPYDQKPTALNLGEYLEAPTCVPLHQHSEVFCVARGKDGEARVFQYAQNRWEWARKIGKNPNGPVGCVANPVARIIQCWASYSRWNEFSERWWSLDGEVITREWSSFGEYSRGRPCVKHVGAIAFPRALAAEGDHMVDAFGNFGGTLTSEPDCASANSRTYDCFAYTEKNGLQRITQYLGILYVRRTSGWVFYEGSFKGKPSCLYREKDRKYHCYMTGTDHVLTEGIFEVVWQGRHRDEQDIRVVI
eukprot:g6290.t1